MTPTQCPAGIPGHLTGLRDGILLGWLFAALGFVLYYLW